MKILIIITKAEIGGAQIAVFNLARELDSRGIEVVVGTGEGTYLKKALDKNSIACHEFRWLKRTKNPLANLFFILELKKFLDESDFHAVHFNSSNALFGAIGAKLSYKRPKTVFTFHGLSMLDENYAVNPAIKTAYLLLFKFLLLFINKKVFVTDKNLAAAGKLKLAFGGKVVHNGLDPASLTYIEKEPARKELEMLCGQLLNGSFLIGSIGRLAYPKNYEFLMKVFRKILAISPRARLVVIGDGPNMKKYQYLVDEMGLSGKIFFIGEIEGAYKLIKGFDLFVLPSKFEGLSITLIEALFAGVPILASAVGGTPEVLGNCEPQLYRLDDEEDFIEKIAKIISDEKLALKLGADNKTLASNFTLKSMVDKYLDAYRS